MQGKIAWIIGGVLAIAGLVLMFMSGAGDAVSDLDSAIRPMSPDTVSAETIKKAKDTRDELSKAIAARRKEYRERGAGLFLKPYEQASTQDFVNFDLERHQNGLEARIATLAGGPGFHFDENGVRVDGPDPNASFEGRPLGGMVEKLREWNTSDTSRQARVPRMAVSCIHRIIEIAETVQREFGIGANPIRIENIVFDRFVDSSDAKARFGEDDPWIRHEFEFETVASAPICDQLLQAIVTSEDNPLCLRLVGSALFPSRVPQAWKIVLSWDDIEALGVDFNADAKSKGEVWDRTFGKHSPIMRDGAKELRDKLADNRNYDRSLPVRMRVTLHLLELRADAPVLTEPASPPSS